MLARMTLALGLLLLPAGASAATGAEVLASLDQKANASKDFTADVMAVTTAPGKGDKKMEFSLRTAGEKRLVVFKAPGDVKDTRVLVLNRTQMYVYLPQYNKIRRVASHVSDQGFMGTAFSDADMSTSHFGAVYSSELKSETDSAYVLKLSRKPEEASPYASLEMTVRKDLGLPSEIRYFSDKGQHVKTELRDDYKCEAQVCIPGTLKMTDHSRGELSTTLNQTVTAIDGGLPDELFTQQALQRGM